ncbi:hypothetical protein HXZ94_15200 [Empedobacter falsenii]|uniref:hypothetical protein n=1 Tax=Empedobacter falsenii TaxID=343874 RepID=UPI00257884B9|nr:hypothetical protein [Empedobacter falsenii]MDM1299841.1 hypothetical protein [Empedobacter falsenii]MDM1319657.1 hypothetical protein [Empedobacter falsenii]
MSNKQPKLSDKIDVLIDQIVNLNKSINEVNISSQEVKTNSDEESISLFSDDVMLIQKIISRLNKNQTEAIVNRVLEIENITRIKSYKQYKYSLILIAFLFLCNLLFLVYNQKTISKINEKSKDDEIIMMIEFFKENPKNYATYVDWLDKNRVRKSN